MPGCIANDDELRMMATVLEDYCRRHSVGKSDHRRREIARVILQLVNLGVRNKRDLANELTWRMDMQTRS